MKRYLAFAGSNSRPMGGWNDCVGDFDEIDEAKKRCKHEAFHRDYYTLGWWHIIDTKNRETVASSEFV